MAATRQRVPAPEQPRGGGLPGAIAAEWTKLWGLKSTWIGLGAVVWAATGAAVLWVLTLRGPDYDGIPPGVFNVDPQFTALGAVQVAQFAVIPMAALIVTAEYATGAIRTTLISTPQRARMFTAKVAVLSAVAFAAGCLVGVSASVVAAVVSDTESPRVSDVLEAMASTGYYVACVSLCTLGLGQLTRSTAAAISITIGVLMCPVFIWITAPGRAILPYLPGGAGMRVISVDVANPHDWVVGALLLAGWAALPLVMGYVAVSRRDT